MIKLRVEKTTEFERARLQSRPFFISAFYFREDEMPGIWPVNVFRDGSGW
jgi:hypothetical protein